MIYLNNFNFNNYNIINAVFSCFFIICFLLSFVVTFRVYFL
jgi:hypothetical protein